MERWRQMRSKETEFVANELIFTVQTSCRQLVGMSTFLLHEIFTAHYDGRLILSELETF